MWSRIEATERIAPRDHTEPSRFKTWINRGELERLGKDDLIELVLRLQRPDNSSRNSLTPPSTDRDEQRENAKLRRREA